MCLTNTVSVNCGFPPQGIQSLTTWCTTDEWFEGTLTAPLSSHKWQIARRSALTILIYVLLRPKYPKYEILWDDDYLANGLLSLFDVLLQPRSGDQGAGPLIRRSQGPLGRGPLGLQAAHRKPETRRRGRLSGSAAIHVLLFWDGIPPPKVADFKSEVELSSEVARLSPARLISPGRAPLGEYRQTIVKDFIGM